MKTAKPRDTITFRIGGRVRIGCLCCMHRTTDTLALDVTPGKWTARSDGNDTIRIYKHGFADEPTGYAGSFRLDGKGGIVSVSVLPRRQGERDWEDPNSFYGRACATISAFDQHRGVHFGTIKNGLIFGDGGDGKRRVYVAWKYGLDIVKVVIRDECERVSRGPWAQR